MLNFLVVHLIALETFITLVFQFSLQLADPRLNKTEWTWLGWKYFDGECSRNGFGNFLKMSQKVSWENWFRDKITWLHCGTFKDTRDSPYQHHPKVFGWRTIRPCLYGLGCPRQPSPRATLAELTFHLFLWKIQLTVYMRTRTRLGGARQLGWASCLASAGRVTLSGGTTFSHVNTLARLPEARWLKLFPEPAILSNL